MPTENETYLTEQDGWTVRIRPPAGEQTPSARPLLLLHGLKGNETVMWIFTGRLPRSTWMFAPRAPIPAENGFTWVPDTGSLHSLDEFTGAAEQLITAFHGWAEAAGAPHDTFDVMGFSQGAALAYVLGALYPQQVQRVMALAGYLPRDPQNRYRAYSGKQVYIAHGSRDETLPVRMAQEAVQTLQSAGADVTYCESDVGHKLAANCLRGLEAFYG